MLTVSVIQVRKFVIRREVQPKEGKEGAKPYTKAPRIQRLVTPQRLQHKRHRIALKRRQAEKAKDAAVSRPVIILKDGTKLTTSSPRTSTLRSSTSVSTRRSPSRLSSARDVLPACASRCCLHCVWMMRQKHDAPAKMRRPRRGLQSGRAVICSGRYLQRPYGVGVR